MAPSGLAGCLPVDDVIEVQAERGIRHADGRACLADEGVLSPQVRKPFC
jgi:hypothetical protein